LRILREYSAERSILIKRSGPLEIKLALEIATQVVGGLAAEHRPKLVHRHIKPSNIMASFEEEGAVAVFVWKYAALRRNIFPGPDGSSANASLLKPRLIQ
jgi:serine/threonine protein kinase